MPPPAQPEPPPGEPAGRLRRLSPAADTDSALRVVEELGLFERPAAEGPRPRVLLNMISTADGRATLAGHSGAIGGAGDRELFHALRTAADAVLVGAGTVRMERYGRLIGDASRRQLRRERGLSEEPLACIVSGLLGVGGEVPLLSEPQARVVVLTSSEASLHPTAAGVEYVRARSGGMLDLRAALVELKERFGVKLVLCEGGPHLACELFAADLVDDLFLTVAPLIASGDAARGEALRIVAGPEIEPPRRLQLRGALESDSHVMLHYGVCA